MGANVIRTRYDEGTESAEVATSDGRGLMKVRNQPKLRRVAVNMSFLRVVLNYETKSKRNERNETKRNETNITQRNILKCETKRNETKYTKMRNATKYTKMQNETKIY